MINQNISAKIANELSKDAKERALNAHDELIELCEQTLAQFLGDLAPMMENKGFKVEGGHLQVGNRYLYPKVLGGGCTTHAWNNANRPGLDKLEAKALKADMASKECNTLYNKLKCAISKVKSLKALKGEFPEAYEAYLKVKGVPAEQAQPCDEIENVRALLNRGKKS